MEIRENQIEDILVNAPSLTKNILRLDEEPRLIGRQIIVPSGRLDILYAYKSHLLLVELKAVPFQRKFIQQVLEYKNDLIEFQNNGKMLKGEIYPYLLCPSVTETLRRITQNANVDVMSYNPEEVLKYFYNNMRPIASLVETKPIDIGIWNLHLVNKFIYYLDTIKNINELLEVVGGAKKTLYNKIKFAKELRLIEWEPHSEFISLSELGRRYINARDGKFDDRLSDEQVNMIKKFVAHNPYESSVILGVASIVEATFTLARNTYPVHMNQLCDFFTVHSGKVYDWQTKKSKYNATRMYSNYAVDLGLLAKTEQKVYITPEGIKFTMQMQLHKSLKMMESIIIN